MDFKKVKNFFYPENAVANTDIELADNYSEFDALFNNDLQSILIVDCNASILQMNNKFKESLNNIKNRTVDIGTSIFEIVSPENHQRIKQDFETALSGKKATHERWVKDYLGQDYCFIYEYTPIKKNGKVTSVMMSILDITSIRATNKIINNHEQQYLALVDGHHSALFITRPDGTIVNANDSAVQMFGYSKEEFLKITRQVFIDHDDPRLEHYLKRRTEIGMVHGELVGIRKNGTRFPIEFSSVIFNNSITGEIQTSTLINDITDKKRDEKISKVTNRVARIGGWEFDLTDNSLYWTDETKEIHEVDFDFIPDFQTAVNFYKEGDDRDRIIKVLEEAIETGNSVEYDFKIITAKAQERWVRTKILVEKHDGKAVRLYGTFQDIDYHKKITLKLEQSEALLSAYFNSTSDTICVLGKNYEILGFNKQYENEIKYILKAELNIGDSILPLMSEKTKAEFINNYQRALNGEQIKSETLVSVGDYSNWWEANYNPIYDNHNAIIGVAFTGVNIDARKKSELALIESKTQIEKSLNELEHQRFALDQHALVNVTNFKGEIIYVNDKFAELSGYTKEQLLGNSHRLLKSNVHNEDFFKELNNTIYAGKVWSGDICNKKRNGELYWLRMTIVPFKDHITNEIIQFISICNNITEKREEETRLKLLESVITNANDAVIITEAEPTAKPGPRILYVNDAFTRMTGYTKEEVIGKSPRILQGPLSDKNELAKLSDALKKWESSEIEIINYHKNGEAFWVNFSVVPIADENGWYTHWISVQRDTTNRKKYEAERQHLIDELSSSINELKQFTYITSHNMRAPVTNLLGIFNILDTSNITDEFTLKLIDGLKKSTYNLNETLNDLIKILIIKENTNLTLDYLSFDETLENVKRSIGSILDNNDAIIHADFKAEAVLFNKSYLESIFLNLITNSIRYAHPGRTIHINIESKMEHDGIKLVYTDNGLGMDMEKVRGQIFGLYKRFHNHPESKGVGLYLVHSQVTSLGGYIDVDSKVGVGTTFTIHFKK